MALKADKGVPCQQYVQYLAAHSIDFRSIAVDHHGVGCWFAAGGDEAFSSLDLYLA
jgi:hypothetical protein